jgi:hypothetical protein
MLIEYYPRILYGKKYYYPSSNDAKAICKLIKRPTLMLEHIQICKDAGWKVKEKKINVE